MYYWCKYWAALIEGSDSWLQPDPASAVTGIWDMNYKLADVKLVSFALTLSISLCLSTK